jgi:prepilin-type N-terminal cleavage/methylation domain-containing protein
MITSARKPSHPSSTPSGFTLIECLLAVIIVSLMLAAVAPAVVLSVATRVQARRVELATQAGSAYVDAVRTKTLPPPPNPNLVVLASGQTAFPQEGQPGFIGAPTATAGWTCTPTAPPADPTKGITPVYCLDGSSKTYLFLVDLDKTPGLSKGDFIVQAFRSVTPDPTDATQTRPNLADNGEQGYLLGVRVYRADAFNGNVVLKTTADPMRSRATAGGVGDRRVPVIQMTTAIRPAASADGGASNYNSLKQRLGIKPSPTPTPTPTPAAGS